MTLQDNLNERKSKLQKAQLILFELESKKKDLSKRIKNSELGKEKDQISQQIKAYKAVINQESVFIRGYETALRDAGATIETSSKNKEARGRHDEKKSETVIDFVAVGM